MISISSIRTYMFCPLKLYLEQNFDEKIDKDILLHRTIKELRIDLQDLFQRNLRRLKKDMSLLEIEENLCKNIEEYIKNSISIIENSEENKKFSNLSEITEKNKKFSELSKITEEKQLNEKIRNQINIDDTIDNENDLVELDEHINLENVEEYEKEIEEEMQKIDEIGEIKIEIEAEAYFNMKILALKAQKAMAMNEKDGSQIAELFFPTSMYSYLMKDKQLEIIGTCDKIEIIDGKYYPISLKSSNPPLKGIWDGDSIELVAAALLIEQEFDTEVFVGFVDYLKIGDRRPVVMDANLRKGLFKVLKEINDILNEKIVPEVNEKREKCLKCDYRSICHQELGM